MIVMMQSAPRRDAIIFCTTEIPGSWPDKMPLARFAEKTHAIQHARMAFVKATSLRLSARQHIASIRMKTSFDIKACLM
jgi:hypothetical protein